jgi:malonyl CoA-acyl carrier protein transacylase
MCLYAQVVKAPAISMADMLQVNPMAAIQMQHIQQQQAALLHSQALLAQLRANAGLSADGTVPAAGTAAAAAAAAAKDKEREDRSRSRGRDRGRSRSGSRSPPAFVKERQRARERQIEKADR